jgi:hypothetical protein
VRAVARPAARAAAGRARRTGSRPTWVQRPVAAGGPLSGARQQHGRERKHPSNDGERALGLSAASCSA